MNTEHSPASILVLDSGVGGIAILNTLIKKLPHEHFIYFADYAYLPYGEKSNQEIQQRLITIVDYFSKNFSLKAIVLACNSATTAAITQLRAHYAIEFFGIEPGIKPAAAQARKGVAVLATRLTLASKQFNTLVQNFAQGKQVYAIAAPELVTLVEAGEGNTLETVKKTIAKIEGEFDVLLLGCTHFCFLKNDFENLLEKQVHIVDTSEAVANRVVDRLTNLKLLSNEANQRVDIFYSACGSAQALQRRLETKEKMVNFNPLDL